MMKLFTILVATIMALSASVYTQGRGNGQAKKTTTTAPKTKAPAHAAKPAAKAETRVARAENRTAKTTAKAETRAAKAEAKAARKSGTTIPATTTTVVTPTTPTTRSVKNPKLEARLLTLLPAGANIQDASQGFKNWGQFVAAVHVSNNLNIPFANLKAQMTGFAPGTTVPTTTPVSLGQAIQSLKGTATTETGTLSSTRIRTEVKKAEDAANVDLRRSRDRS
ncbi:MAG: hypothetical protein ABIS29_02230 [Vicinamibacterales bacterium]